MEYWAKHKLLTQLRDLANQEAVDMFAAAYYAYAIAAKPERFGMSKDEAGEYIEFAISDLFCVRIYATDTIQVDTQSIGLDSKAEYISMHVIDRPLRRLILATLLAVAEGL